jgi:hypothetical protein
MPAMIAMQSVRKVESERISTKVVEVLLCVPLMRVMSSHART